MGVEVKPVSKESYEDVLTLLGKAFKAPTEYFRRHQLDDPDYSYEQGRVVSRDGRVISHVQVFHRTMRYGTGRIRFGAIGDVGTDPAERRAGHATTLLQDAIRYMEAQDMPLSMLYTGTHALYAKCGWRTIPATVLEAETPPVAKPGPRAYVVKPFEGPELKDLEEFYDQAMSNQVGPTLRSTTYFRRQPGWMEVLGPVYWDVIYKVGHPAGYVRTRRDGEKLIILDVCASNDQLARVACAQVMKRAIESSCRTIQGRISAELPFVKQLGDFASFQLKPGEHQMMRLNDLRGVLEGALPELHRRRRHSMLAEPSIVLKVGAAAVRIEFPSGTVRLGEPTGHEAEMELTDVAFLRLLMGLQGSHAALEQTDLEARLKPQLRTIFPETGHVCWIADTF